MVETGDSPALDSSDTLKSGRRQRARNSRREIVLPKANSKRVLLVAGIAGTVLVIALAVGFWLIGLLFALCAAVPTLRYWDGLSITTRWLGALPLLSVSLFFTAGLVAVLFV